MAPTRMPAIQVATAAGEIVLLGNFTEFQPERPLVLALPGAVQSPEHLMGLPRLLPDADVIIGLLPGMYAPHHARIGVREFAGAFDAALAARFPARRPIVLGFSVGGLVAMAMRSPAAFVAVDAPLTTDALWPIVDPLRAEIAAGGNPRLGEWAWEILGLGREAVENRDYRPLLESLAGPGVYIVAGEPLEPPRPVRRAPGALTEADRSLVAATPGVTAMVVANCGHNLLAEAPGAISMAVGMALERASPR